MLKSALIAAAVIAVAAPAAYAKSSARSKTDTAAVENTNGPIPYSELAAADAKMGGSMGGAKHHMAKKKGKSASAGASTSAAGSPTSSTEVSGATGANNAQ